MTTHAFIKALPYMSLFRYLSMNFLKIKISKGFAVAKRRNNPIFKLKNKL